MSATSKRVPFALIEAKSENANSIVFTAEHKDLETLHNIEIQKDEIQKYLAHCGQNFIPSNKIANIMHLDSTLDICEDIVRFGGEYSITDQELTGWNVRTIYGKTDFVSVKEYGANFIETLRNSMAILSTEAVYR